MEALGMNQCIFRVFAICDELQEEVEEERAARQEAELDCDEQEAQTGMLAEQLENAHKVISQYGILAWQLVCRLCSFSKGCRPSCAHLCSHAIFRYIAFDVCIATNDECCIHVKHSIKLTFLCHVSVCLPHTVTGELPRQRRQGRE